MLPYQQRVVDEKRELDDRLTKLGAFIQGSVATSLFRGLPDDEQSRLIRQHHHMRKYSEVLGERIAKFGS